jgi:hypothetical protein
MVQVNQYQGTNGNAVALWNLSSTTQFGSTGDDVKLVQYLLARAPEAGAYESDKISGQSGIAVSDVDGIWGQQTAAALSWLEQSWKGNHPVVADSRVDPTFGGTITFGPDGIYEYKILVLQHLYAVAMMKHAATSADTATMSSLGLSMPDDGQCPPDLGYALRAASGNTGSSDPDDGS